MYLDALKRSMIYFKDCHYNLCIINPCIIKSFITIPILFKLFFMHTLKELVGTHFTVNAPYMITCDK